MKIFNFKIDGSPNLKTEVLCIGKFDGIHKGHESLFNEAKNFTNTFGILTFNPPPFVYFQKNAKILFTQEEKEIIFQDAGIDSIYSLEFNSQLANMDGEDFCKKVANIGKTFIIGEDFHFGKGRKWNALQMQEFGKKYNFDVKIVKNLYNVEGDHKISSKILKDCIKVADFKTFELFSLHKYFTLGKVVYGKQIASSALGFPTANITFDEDKIIPPFSVYATTIMIDGETYRSISNFGIKPTFENNIPILETHIFDFGQNIYNKTVKITFIDKIRDEIKFSDINKLKIKILEDIEICKKIHNDYENYKK